MLGSAYLNKDLGSDGLKGADFLRTILVVDSKFKRDFSIVDASVSFSYK